MLHTLKNATVTFPPNRPHQTQSSEIPNIREVFPKPIHPTKQKVHYTALNNPCNPEHNWKTKLHNSAVTKGPLVISFMKNLGSSLLGFIDNDI